MRRTAAFVFGVFAQPRVLPPHVQHALVQVDVLPLQTEQFDESQAREQRRAEKRV
jgi:hypothetical protein